MDFNTVRILLLALEVNIESDINDYKVVISHEDKLRNINLSETMRYGEIPFCFNCIVHEFDIDLDNRKIWIKSEVVKHE